MKVLLLFQLYIKYNATSDCRKGWKQVKVLLLFQLERSELHSSGQETALHRMQQITLPIGVLLVFCLVCSAAAQEKSSTCNVYVSNKGNDGHAGTIHLPFFTLDRYLQPNNRSLGRHQDLT